MSQTKEFLKEILSHILTLEKKYGLVTYLIIEIETNQQLEPFEASSEKIELINGELYCTKIHLSVFRYDKKKRVFIDLKRFEDIQEACSDKTIREMIIKAVEGVKA